eukprot:scaffold3304_cov154-Amphora_coffeaeformis.AAC.14
MVYDNLSRNVNYSPTTCIVHVKVRRRMFYTSNARMNELMRIKDKHNKFSGASAIYHWAIR